MDLFVSKKETYREVADLFVSKKETYEEVVDLFISKNLTSKEDGRLPQVPGKMTFLESRALMAAWRR
jgi:hypothetical protein